MHTEVLVIGGGPAGIAASIAAARRGAKVLLVERFGSAGGTFSQGLALTPVGFEPFKYWTTETDPEGWAVQGIARELHDRLVAEEAVCKPVWDVETYKWVADRMLVEAGVDVLFHARFADVIRDGDRVTGAILATKRGLERVRADVTIDCSGDGDVFAAAGCAFDMGRPEDGRPQPATLASIFANVRMPYTPEMSYAEMMAVSQTHIGPLLREGVLSGELPAIFVGIFFPRVVRGRVLRDQLWCRLVQYWGDPTDPRALSRGEIASREAIFAVHDYLRRKVAGFEASALVQTSTQTWPREARRLQGLSTLHEDDVRSNARFDDGIAHGTCFLEVHSATPGDPNAEKGFAWDLEASLYYKDIDYDIRYGCLLPADVGGLLVAGRNISATHLAQSSSRMQITCMALGEAAGTAASLAVRDAVDARELDLAVLREALRARGARV